MNQRRYQGRLHYDNSATDYVDLQSFIVRDSEIGFSLDSVSSEHGRWTAESGKPATRQEDGTFLAQDVRASKLRTKASSSWRITFNIENEATGEMIEVSGSIEESGEIGTFYGELVVSR